MCSLLHILVSSENSGVLQSEKKKNKTNKMASDKQKGEEEAVVECVDTVKNAKMTLLLNMRTPSIN